MTTLQLKVTLVLSNELIIRIGYHKNMLKLGI